ncbi:hypothetical protein L1987_48025 [Smallanthus sonchifolius]|uniref:Uncharacterized protein n=1 Tax=Smallanthus sonchifolius TaxID=185202 RepID=A0ACB9FRP8_9ASTR|nr:hypothetical protein L1987_48025 [Smallanthus sonchifolius]
MSCWTFLQLLQDVRSKIENCFKKKPTTCFECGEAGHIKTYCPKLKKPDGTGPNPAGGVKKNARAFVLNTNEAACMPDVITGCLAYLVTVTTDTKKKIEDVPVVADFPDIFPEELPGIPPEREVEFRINLVPGTAPIVKAPYKLAPTEMAELKKQLDELLEKDS